MKASLQSDRDSGDHTNPSECLRQAEFHWMATVMLEKASSVRLLDGQTAALHEHLLGCRPCRVQLNDELRRRENERERALAAQRPDLGKLAELLRDSSPRAWPSPARWPEADLALDTLLGPRKGATGHDPKQAWRLLSTLLRDLLLTRDPGLERTRLAREYLRSRVRAMSQAGERVVTSFACGNPQAEASACRDCAEEEPHAAAAWDSAADCIERLEPSHIAEFRQQVQLALSHLLGDSLNTEVIRPLEAMGWEGVVYVPDASGRTLEAVAASDQTLVHAVRHPILTTTPDIEVDIYRRRRAERLLGGNWDNRFSPCLWKRCGHKLFIDRGFFPLGFAQHPQDCSVVEPCHWVREASHVWRAEVPNGFLFQPVGSMSISRTNKAKNFQEVLEFASQHAAFSAYRASLRGFCETMLCLLIKRFGAQHGALHVGTDPDSIFSETSHESHSGHLLLRVDNLGGVADAPRRDGIGAEAIARQTCIHVHGDQLEWRNPRLWHKGVRLTSAAPLYDAAGDLLGVIYLHYERDDRAASLDEFLREVGYALGLALTAQGRIRVTPTVLAEARTFARPAVETLPQRLERLAEFALNFLGADHVSIAANVPSAEPETVIRHAGRYVEPPATVRRTEAANALNDCIVGLAPAEPVLVPEWSEQASRSEYRRGRFVEQEGIQASAVLPLLYNNQRIGLVIVDYRYQHDFGSERDVLEKLAGLLAAGVQVLLAGDTDEVMERAAERVVDLSAAAAIAAGRRSRQAIRVGFEAGKGSKKEEPASFAS